MKLPPDPSHAATDQLAALAERIGATDDDALLGCRVFEHDLVIRIGASTDGSVTLIELYDAGTLERAGDRALLREALAMSAAVETLMDLVDVDLLSAAAATLRDDSGSAMAPIDRSLREDAADAADSVLACVLHPAPVVADATLLDELASTLTSLDTAWTALEVALGSIPPESDMMDAIEARWRIVASVRGTALRVPARDAAFGARQAAVAMLDDVMPLQA